MHILFDRNIYDLSVKYLSKNKTPSPDNIPNSILKNMPHRFHNLLFLFFQHCYKQKTIPQSWKTSNTILIYKKGNSSHLSNHHPIALANTIYKLFTSTLTSILSTYRELNQILYNSQEGFRQERCTSRQIQMLIAALEDSKFSSQDIYLLYIDFTNAFGSIDHARLLAIMEDLGYPLDSVKLIDNIYANSHTTFIGTHFIKTKLIPVQRGTIQGDTLSPYLFLIFLEPLLRWLDRDNSGYTFKTSKTTIGSTTYADDLAVISSSINHIQPQLNKIVKFCLWAGLGLGINKCALTGNPNRTKRNPPAFTIFFRNQNIAFKNQPTKQSCVQSPITRTLYLLKKVAEAHTRSINEDLPLQRIQLEELWFAQCTNHPNITNKILLHFLNNLFLHHITDLSQLTRPNGNQLIYIDEFIIHYGQPNKIIKNILKLAEKLFCHPTCEINCVQPCPHHQPPCTLLPQFHIPPHELPNHPQPNQTQNITPPPPRPPPHIWRQLKNYPPNNILKHHYHNKIDIHGTTKQYNTYFCQWNYPPNLIYRKWLNQNSLFP